MSQAAKTSDMNQLLLKSIEALPPLPQTVRELHSYISTAGANLQIAEVARIISSDPVVTAKLLQIANSPFYGFSREVTTIQQVVNLLGVANIKNIIATQSVQGSFKVDVSAYGLDTNHFLKSCNEEVQFISDWLLMEDKKLSYLLVPCAMLIRFGMIVFSNFLIQNNKDAEFLKALKDSKFSNIAAIEEQFLGVDHISFLSYLFHKWDFDEVLIETVAFVNTPHAADGDIKRNAYALDIANNIFALYDSGSEFRVDAALSLIKEAKGQGVDFNMDNFLSKLPDFVRKNLKP